MKKSIGVQTSIFPNPTFAVGTYDEVGVANVINIAWGGIASSDPASIAIAIRPSRYSHDNILKRKAFTVNLVPAKYVTENDYFGIASGRNVNKLETVGLTAVKGEYVDAPYILEFPFNIECKLTNTIDLGAHTLFVGEIKDVKADEAFLNDKDQPLFEKAEILTYDGSLDEYRLPGKSIAKAFSAGVPLLKR
jgi:flavin reductase (DIM6/NTAB) family NADH-FMN oxidoreductase RutF